MNVFLSCRRSGAASPVSPSPTPLHPTSRNNPPKLFSKQHLRPCYSSIAFLHLNLEAVPHHPNDTTAFVDRGCSARMGSEHGLYS
jgi:hypothetical protein